MFKKSLCAIVLASTIITTTVNASTAVVKKKPVVVTNKKSTVKKKPVVVTNKKSTVKKKPVVAKTKISYAPSKQIIYANFNSGLIQINNDVFQQGGYMTVAELVQKYSNKYDFSYKGGTYKERKDYLLEYYKNTTDGMIYNNAAYLYKYYYIILTPKYGNKQNKVRVYIGNITSQDKKITLDKAVILDCTAETSGASCYSESNTPMWIPKGISFENFDSDQANWKMKDEDKIKSMSKNYNAQNLPKFLESQGLKFVESQPGLTSDIHNHNIYWKRGDYIFCYVTGRKNLGGEKPLYYYSFRLNPDTDKLEDTLYTINEYFKD